MFQLVDFLLSGFRIVVDPVKNGKRHLSAVKVLQNKYTDFSVSFEHQLPIEGLYFTGTAYNRFRETNTIDLAARSFRGYTNQYAELGLKWKL